MIAPPEEPAGLERVKEIVEGQARVLDKHGEALTALISEMRGINKRLEQVLRVDSRPRISGSTTPSGGRNSTTTSTAVCGRAREVQCLYTAVLTDIRAATFAFMVSLLTGRALQWATAVWQHLLSEHATLSAFVDALRATFHHPHAASSVVSPLLSIHQEGRSVADYTVEFHTRAASSGWNDAALMAAYTHGLSERLKDELALRDPPQDLEEFHRLAIRVDNRLRDRQVGRSGSSRRGTSPPPQKSHSTRQARRSPSYRREVSPLPMETESEASDPVPDIEPEDLELENMGEPMQIGIAMVAPQRSSPWGSQRASDACGEVHHRRGHPKRGGSGVTQKSGPRHAGLFLPATLSGRGIRRARTEAFIDTGAKGNFIDGKLAAALGIPVSPLPSAIPLVSLAGQPIKSGCVTHRTVPVLLRLGRHSEQISFLVTRVPEQRVVLGFPWLHRHNPRIDWPTRSISNWGCQCTLSCLKGGQPPVLTSTLTNSYFIDPL